MLQEVRLFVESAQVGDLDTVKTLQIECKNLTNFNANKKRQLSRELEIRLIVERMQSGISATTVPENIESIFRSIKIHGLRSFSIGFKTDVIKCALSEMKIFDDNVNDDISQFADSLIFISDAKYSDGNITKNVRKWMEPEDQRDLLNSFPIFGMIPNLKQFLPLDIIVPDVEWKWEGWGDDLIWNQLKLVLEGWGDDIRWKYLRELGLKPKRKLEIYEEYSYKEESDSEFEDEIEEEWNQFVTMVNSISKSTWVEIFGMLYHGRNAPCGGNRHDYLLAKLDPDNKFFRRKNKSRKRKRDSDN